MIDLAESMRLHVTERLSKYDAVKNLIWILSILEVIPMNQADRLNIFWSKINRRLASDPNQYQ